MKEGLKTSLNSYVFAAEVIKSLVEKQSSNKVPEQTYEAWKSLMILVRHADLNIDNTGSKAQRNDYYDNSLRYLDGEISSYEHEDKNLVEAMTEFKELLSAFPEKNRRMFLASLKGVFRVTEKIKETKDIEEFSKMTRLEGQLSGKLLMSLLPEDFRTTTDFSSLLKHTNYLTRFANSLDTFVDFSGDYSLGEIKMRPSIRNRSTVLVKGMRDLSMFLPKTDLGTLGLLSKAGVQVLQNNLRRSEPSY